MSTAYITAHNRSDAFDDSEIYTIHNPRVETVIALRYSHLTDSLDGWPDPKEWLAQYITCDSEDRLYFAPADELDQVVRDYDLTVLA